MLSLCQLPPSLLSFFTWMITIASFLWETFLLSPDEVLKPFSKQHPVKTVLHMLNKWNPICHLLSVLLHQMVCSQYRLSQHLALAAGTEGRWQYGSSGQDRNYREGWCYVWMPLLLVFCLKLKISPCVVPVKHLIFYSLSEGSEICLQVGQQWWLHCGISLIAESTARCSCCSLDFYEKLTW